MNKKRKEILIAIVIFLAGIAIGFFIVFFSIRNAANFNQAAVISAPQGPNCGWWEDVYENCGGGWSGFSCRFVISLTAEAIGCESLL